MATPLTLIAERGRLPLEAARRADMRGNCGLPALLLAGTDRAFGSGSHAPLMTADAAQKRRLGERP
jgi:hypothetical protein